MNAGRILKEGESARPGILGAETNSNSLMHRRQSLEKPGKYQFLSVLLFYSSLLKSQRNSIINQFSPFIGMAFESGYNVVK